jgi:Flp pilus assembly protein TadG
MTKPNKKSQRGTSLVEFVLNFLLLFFLFIGVIDFGFFGSAAIDIQNAARVGALYTSSGAAHDTDQAGACTRILAELQSLPNYSAMPATCNASPLVVTAVTVTAPDNTPAAKVTVTYQTLSLIQIPGLPNGLSITRVVEMRVRG